MRVVDVTNKMIANRQLKDDCYYYPLNCKRYVRAGSVVDEPGTYWESEFYYMGIVDDYAIMSEIDRKITSGAIKGEIDGYGYERISIPSIDYLTYEVQITPLNRA